MKIRTPLSTFLLAAALAACGGGAPGGGGSDGVGSESAGSSAPGTPPWKSPAAESGGGAPADPEEAESPLEPAPEPTDVRYVAPGGDDGADGSETSPWATVAHAVAQATPGMKIVVQGGTWPALDITSVDGTEDAPIVLAGAEDERPIFTGPVTLQRAFWELEHIEVASPEPRFALRFTGDGSHDNVVRNSVVRDGRGAAGVSVDLGAHRILIEGNEIYGIDRGEDDAHGIVVQPTTREVAIIGNEIHGTSGDSVQCIGPGQDAVQGAPANGVFIEGNHLYDTRENAVDIKHCEDVTIRGNVMHGFRKSSTSNGEAVVVHLKAKGVIVEENDISNTSRGIVTGRGATDVLLRRNRLHGLADERTAILFAEGAGLEAHHNTIVGAAYGVKALDGSNRPTVRNHVFESVEVPLQGDLAAENNLFSNSEASGDAPIHGDAALDGDLVPGPTSAAIDAALPGDEAEACGEALDLGAIERC